MLTTQTVERGVGGDRGPGFFGTRLACPLRVGGDIQKLTEGS